MSYTHVGESQPPSTKLWGGRESGIVEISFDIRHCSWTLTAFGYMTLGFNSRVRRQLCRTAVRRSSITGSDIASIKFGGYCLGYTNGKTILLNWRIELVRSQQIPDFGLGIVNDPSDIPPLFLADTETAYMSMGHENAGSNPASPTSTGD